jgi:hypothetical protein
VQNLGLIQHSYMELVFNLWPRVPASLRYLCSCILHRMHRNQGHDFFPILLGTLPATPLPLLPCILLVQQKRPFSGTRGSVRCSQPLWEPQVLHKAIGLVFVVYVPTILSWYFRGFPQFLQACTIITPRIIRLSALSTSLRLHNSLITLLLAIDYVVE